MLESSSLGVEFQQHFFFNLFVCFFFSFSVLPGLGDSRTPGGIRFDGSHRDDSEQSVLHNCEGQFGDFFSLKFGFLFHTCFNVLRGHKVISSEECTNYFLIFFVLIVFISFKELGEQNELDKTWQLNVRRRLETISFFFERFFVTGLFKILRSNRDSCFFSDF